MLKVTLACYVDLEERLGCAEIEEPACTVESARTAYDIVKAYALSKVGKFTSAEVTAACPRAGRSSVLAALKKLTDEGLITKLGSGRTTCYVRTDAI